MTRARVIPCLLLRNGGLVKTIGFGKPTYVGDPVNVISIFNLLEVDELVLLDITATPERRGPDFALVERIANECTGPLAVGGGIRSIEDIRRLLFIGAEKVVINTEAARNPRLVREAADIFGSQAIVVAIDVRRRWMRGYRAMANGGRTDLGIDPVKHAAAMAEAGAGEILLTSIDRDGTMSGYDLDLIRQVTAAVSVPVIACGGAGCRADLARPVLEAAAAAAAAGSLFVFQGPERGVLINLPSRAELDDLFSGNPR
ncbi:AglZ/HisF2 family acetamidino modification protein [Magnetospirillum moscoviense]|uniref:Imidazole glycerol phosphate synthase subunit HisF n=1 Tax=Magnetospirillum moscoviense TaxID=1437059 RepID=A0A178MWZ7_9PROT|nr:AglZ/HisF2 family acetamidino modification protein [Magnetospirillum moscoviense]OAN55159.1 imidazole glycerol phosphate synthase subunit HisF [Magnetospirillum moscoviense]